MGSKNRISKHILPILLQNRQENQPYIEPFVGGANMIDKVNGRRIGNDSHPYLISMWQALQRGWIPPENVSKELYYQIKNNTSNYEPSLVGFVGFLCSFGGKWWGGYAANSKGDNYAARGSRQLLKQIENLKGVTFTNNNYYDIPITEKSIIYCDPPYQGTTEYKNKFDHNQFWDWVRLMSKDGHQVFVSEYTAPQDFQCIKEVQHKTILDKNSQYPRVERLFVYHENL